MEDLFLTIKASLKSGSSPFLQNNQLTGGKTLEVNLPFSVYSHELQFLPTSLDHILYAQIKLAAHDDCVRLFSQLI